MSKSNSTSVVRENIEAVANLEQQFLDRRGPVDRVVDTVADFTGTLTVVVIHFTAFACWLTVNLGFVPFLPRFDPYPFALLSTAVSCEAVLLSTFVLMKQNRMATRADERDHLHLQINLLAEKEITKMLQTLTAMCDHMGLKTDDPQIRELSENTAVDDLAQELREKVHNIT
jgi:uncharacterized membrane protein